MSDKPHWEEIYAQRSATNVSWYRPHLDVSLDLIRETGVKTDARIIDVGGGASTLVDDLIDIGYTNVTVLDISQSALEVARARLGT
jgi:2-polyprenyl-3-methyl-5-hydroxy-6-metoxy-1,4-benzoquinol methylase